jgi:hypothetical protein
MRGRRGYNWQFRVLSAVRLLGDSKADDSRKVVRKNDWSYDANWSAPSFRSRENTTNVSYSLPGLSRDRGARGERDGV